MQELNLQEVQMISGAECDWDYAMWGAMNLDWCLANDISPSELAASF